jgi:hypothetical protein
MVIALGRSAPIGKLAEHLPIPMLLQASPSFPRRRESMIAGYAGLTNMVFMDSRLHGNDKKL